MSAWPTRIALALGTALFGLAGAATAQSSRAADSLLRRGSLVRAESLYYAAVRTKPRDPLPRWALGRYLAERGAPRVATTLMEEAIQFGGPDWSQLVSGDLARLYLSLGEYRSLLALPMSPLTNGERDQARWLQGHPSRLIMPDSEMLIAYTPASARYVGRMLIRVDGQTLEAAISVSARGITIRDTNVVGRRMRRFESNAAKPSPAIEALPGVADSVAFGRVTLMSVPVHVQSMSPRDSAIQAIVGLDVLSQFSPTFDPRNKSITLHAGRPAQSSAAGAGVTTYPTRLTDHDFLVLQQAGGWASASAPPVSRLLSEQRWTFDTKRGQLFIEH